MAQGELQQPPLTPNIQSDVTTEGDESASSANNIEPQEPSVSSAKPTLPPKPRARAHSVPEVRYVRLYMAQIPVTYSCSHRDITIVYTCKHTYIMHTF